MTAAIDHAMNFLRDALGAGPINSKGVRKRAEGAGLAWATVRRAKERLGVQSIRHSENGDGAGEWIWSLSQGAQILAPQDARALVPQEAQTDAAQDARRQQDDHLPHSTPVQGAQTDEPQAAQAQGAHGNAWQGARTAPRPKRHVVVRHRGAAAIGPDEVSWEEFETLDCDLSRVADYVRQRDLQERTVNAEV
jgi:hypothetical protein